MYAKINVFFISLLFVLTSCSSTDKTDIKIPRLPRHVIAEVQKHLPIETSQGGHVTEEKQKIPLLGFKTTYTIQNSEELLKLYKEVYLKLATAMTPEEETSSWEGKLFIKKQPKVWLSFSNSSKTDMFPAPPAIALISMGPGGILGLSYWNSKTRRLERKSETSLCELFKEELSSDGLKQEG